MIESKLKIKFETLNNLSESEKENRPHINCCEHILMAGNEVYDLGLTSNVMKIAKGFGGGIKIESTCGAVTGSVMVLGLLFEDQENFDQIVQDFMMLFKSTHKTIDCGPLKEKHMKDGVGCQPVIIMAARVLDEIILKSRKR